jgi:hypothetical protein
MIPPTWKCDWCFDAGQVIVPPREPYSGPMPIKCPKGCEINFRMGPALHIGPDGRPMLPPGMSPQ